MLLIPALVAVLVLGLSPLGVWLAAGLSRVFVLPASAWLVLLFAIVIGGGYAILEAFRRALPPEPFPGEDDPWEIGSGRGQGHFPGLVALTLVAVGIVLLVGGGEPARLILTAAAAVLAFLPVPVRASSWPPPLPEFQPPRGPRADAEPSERGVESGECGETEDPNSPLTTHHSALRLSYAWEFFDSLGSVERRGSSFAISLRVPKAMYEDFRRREHPDPGSPPTDFSALATYVRDGLAPPVRECARQLVEKSVGARLPYLDVVSFVLAFTGSVARSGGSDETGETDEPEHVPLGPRYARFPIETLVERRGTDRDFAVLAAAILRAMGVEALLWAVQLNDGSVHTALGVPATLEAPGLHPPLTFEGRGYYYGEVTPTGPCRIGEMPHEFTGKVRREVPVPLD